MKKAIAEALKNGVLVFSDGKGLTVSLSFTTREDYERFRDKLTDAIDEAEF